MGLPSLVLFLLILFFPAFSMQQDAPIYLQCLRNTTTSLSSSTFASNLNTALRNFTTISSQGSKYGAAAGNSGLYAVFQCRGDLSAQSCGQCVQNVTARLSQECPTSVEARIRLDGCFLRYDNQSFFSLDTTYVMGLCNTANTSDVVTLSTIADLMENVTSEAPKQDGYWASAREIGVYAAAQCLGYLSQSECSQCLRFQTGRPGASGQLRSPLRNLQLHGIHAPRRCCSGSQLSSCGCASWRPSAIPSAIAGRAPIACRFQDPHYCRQHVCWIRGCQTGQEKGAKPVDKTASWSRQLLQKRAELFSLEELEEATGHFHPTNKLGEGGFGIVYKGTLKNGEQVAIKKLSIGSQQGKQEFLNEVNLITSVQHKNLVRLLGCCVEGLERMLVYEYLSNKSLDFFLARGNRILNWSTRYGIVVGMAKGLAYLHEESHTQIIHRDIKPSNILLDDQLNPVIADFGLARLVKDDATHVNTGVAGTIGYLSPEYALNGVLSEKVDVFSFGLVTLEVITGKQNVHSRLLTWVWEKYRDEKVLELVDEKLGMVMPIRGSCPIVCGPCLTM